jgi:hypothetical protein
MRLSCQGDGVGLGQTFEQQEGLNLHAKHFVLGVRKKTVVAQAISEQWGLLPATVVDTQMFLPLSNCFISASMGGLSYL